MNDINNNIDEFNEAYKEFNSNYKQNFNKINGDLKIFNFVRSVYNDKAKLNVAVQYFNGYKLLYDSFLIPSSKSSNETLNISTSVLDKDYGFINLDSKDILFVNLTESSSNHSDISENVVNQVSLNDLSNDYNNSNIEDLNGVKKVNVDNYNISTLKNGECNLDNLKECYSKSVLQNDYQESDAGEYFGVKDKFNNGGNSKECECYYSIKNDLIPIDSTNYEIRYVDVSLPTTHSTNPPLDIHYLSILLDGKLYSVHKENYEEVFNNFLTEKDNTITAWGEDSVIESESNCNVFAGSGIHGLTLDLEKYVTDVKNWHDNNCNTESDTTDS